MSQPYDLSGLASLNTSIAQMLADQKSGAVKFAGGSQTWIPNPAGSFKAKLSSAAGLTPYDNLHGPHRPQGGTDNT
jgi:hypothetical protein